MDPRFTDLASNPTASPTTHDLELPVTQLHYLDSSLKRLDLSTDKEKLLRLTAAERRAKSRTETRMSYWKENVDQIITSNGFPLLKYAGSISHQEMEEQISKLYLGFDQRRKQQEALEADQADELISGRSKTNLNIDAILDFHFHSRANIGRVSPELQIWDYRSANKASRAGSAVRVG